MPDKECKSNEAVCIDTKRIYDSCADKDCVADVRLIFTNVGQQRINAASTVRCRGCEILNCFIDVEEVSFNRGFYSVDITYFFRVTLDVFTGPLTPPIEVSGLAVFSKKAILYGSEGRVKVFSSEYSQDEFDGQLASTRTTPVAKVQCVDPICLDATLQNVCECACNECQTNIPEAVQRQFIGDFVEQQDAQKEVLVTLGLFTIVQLERDVQLLIPSYDFCIPTKECSCDTDDPCDAFRKIKFPLNEFFPPDEIELDELDFVTSRCGCSGT